VVGGGIVLGEWMADTGENAQERGLEDRAPWRGVHHAQTERPIVFRAMRYSLQML
jgi:hypothetical protein